MSSICNLTIEEFINEENDDLKYNFIGVFPYNFITRFIAFHQLIKEKRGSYPFMIINTDRSNKKGIHQWFRTLTEKRCFYLADLVSIKRL